MTDPQTEQAWVREAQAGSTLAFGRLVGAHQQGLRAFLRRLSPADADDLAQDAFVFAWEHIGRFDATRPFKPWLFGIGWRKCRQGRRGWLRMLTRQGRYAAEQPQVTTADPDAALDLARVTAQLPPDQRAAILLCLGLEFTQDEAATALSLPLGTVKSHVARGREKLAHLLGDSA